MEYTVFFSFSEMKSGWNFATLTNPIWKLMQAIQEMRSDILIPCDSVGSVSISLPKPNAVQCTQSLPTLLEKHSSYIIIISVLPDIQSKLFRRSWEQIVNGDNMSFPITSYTRRDNELVVIGIVSFQSCDTKTIDAYIYTPSNTIYEALVLCVKKCWAFPISLDSVSERWSYSIFKLQTKATCILRKGQAPSSSMASGAISQMDSGQINV